MVNQLIQIARKMAHAIGIDIVRYRGADTTLPLDFDPDVIAIWHSVKAHTMASPARISTLCDAVKYLEKNDIDGAIVECGVWRGGSMMAVAKTLLNLDSRNRELYLFYTFEGMSPATEVDIDPQGVSAKSIFDDPLSNSLPWQPESLEGVKAAIKSTGYPLENCHFIKGKVEDTVPDHAPTEIALLRLDTDWYESTRHEMIHLFPHVVKGGVLIIDDYGYWEGARKAVDEYIAENSTKVLLVRVDDTARMAVVQ